MEAALGIYLHIPFCAGKCPYCDFNSQPAGDGEIERYGAALLRETALRLSPGLLADTIYFGGGTPTLAPPALLRRLLETVRARVTLAADAEISLEANPESVSGDRLAALLAAGFNRLSIGAQSFDDRVLAALGRRHDAACAARAVQSARAVGWSNISLDLIFGAPDQSLASWAATLRRAIALGPDHISAYCLTIEPDTEFGRRRAAGRLSPLGEEDELAMYETACAMLGRAGYQRYEVSNFALAGKRCRHNEKYWRGGDYLGLGAGAHSRVAGVRWANAADASEYASLLGRGRLPVVYAERLSGRRRMDEELMLALRTAEGACLAELGARCGRDAGHEYRNMIERLVGAGLAQGRGTRLALTDRGMNLASEVAARLMA